MVVAILGQDSNFVALFLWFRVVIDLFSDFLISALICIGSLFAVYLFALEVHLLCNDCTLWHWSTIWYFIYLGRLILAFSHLVLLLHHYAVSILEEGQEPVARCAIKPPLQVSPLNHLWQLSILVFPILHLLTHLQAPLFMHHLLHHSLLKAITG